MSDSNRQYEPSIEGRRLVLRPIRQADVTDRYVSWLNDPQVNQFLETRFRNWDHQSVSEFVSQVQAKEEELLLAICLRESGLHIGNIKIGPIDPHHRRADVSLLIGEKDQWGKGFATEAIALVTRLAFDSLKLNKLVARCYGENKGSAKAFLKCGYRQEGVLREYFISHGNPTDQIIFGMTARGYHHGC